MFRNKGDFVIFTYKGAKEEIDLLPGKYLLEVWGASGGKSHGVCGKGGYSKGILTLHQGNHLFVYVGGKGQDAPDRTWTSWQAKGGFNGGGNAKVNGSNKYINCAAGGGGATDIRLEVDDLDHRIIVAGGAGGAGCQRMVSPAWIGGFGGGLSGGCGWYESRSRVAPGTQTGGFAKGQGQSGSVIGWNNAAYAAEGSGGGGGGYWGGYCITSFGSYSNGSGAGGSGYIDSILDEGETIGDQHVGDGEAKITLVGYTYTILIQLKGEILLH